MLAEVDPNSKPQLRCFILKIIPITRLQRFEVPLGTVKSRIARGLAQLRESSLKTPTDANAPGEVPS
jgi:hypothetical protein